ncbi:BA14K family protein [Mesorhizobium sp. CGMCC 1.15528]|uniref:Lectin-like protein BA14k n=1 Tax=Mesorhizobium zhangyense TaxID=1776730 RepID=A0A7C9R4E2_9HYPH|nr:BA14K family protein [Mesorhizobium zhangyense]NGN39882.1 BA14K family protein [Mesorhizobium zhangyense]
MKKFLSGLCASALALSFAIVPAIPGASAAPAYVPPAATTQSDVQQVQYDPYRRAIPSARHFRGDRRDFRRGWRDGRRDGRRFERRGDYNYYRGHRGYRNYRRGYREYNGYWFPAAAFITGAIVGGAIAAPPPVREYRGGGNAHVRWCYNRYRSYRAYDNTFQPYNGPRQQCYSPY